LATTYSAVNVSARQPLPLDASLAHKLYRGLFGVIAETIKGKQLLIVATGLLSALPLHVLVTERPVVGVLQDATGYATMKWPCSWRNVRRSS
jgi:hypothetical protein